MNAIDVLVTLFFLVNMGVFLAKIYNILVGTRKGRDFIYGRELVILGAVVSMFSWVIVLSVFSGSSLLGDFYVIQYGLYNSITTALMSFSMILTVVELLLVLTKESEGFFKGPVKPKRAR